jgi:hypothetical protein
MCDFLGGSELFRFAKFVFFLSLLGIYLFGCYCRRWVDNIKMDLRETGWDGMDWIDLSQDRDQLRALVNTVMNLRIP